MAAERARRAGEGGDSPPDVNFRVGKKTEMLGVLVQIAVVFRFIPRLSMLIFLVLVFMVTTALLRRPCLLVRVIFVGTVPTL